MKSVSARVQVNADRTVEVQLPEDLPIGEYKAVLIPIEKQANETSLATDGDEQTQWNRATDDFWERWTKEVEQIPLSPQPAQSEYHKSLIEKYSEQGLDL